MSHQLPLSDFSHPLLQSIGLLAISLFCLAIHRYRASALFFLVGALWLALCATPTFATWLQHSLENQYPPRQVSSYPAADAIVVLGGGELPDFSGDQDDETAAERATRAGFALELYHAHRAPIILLSGAYHEALQMAQRLQQQGVPATSLRTETKSTNTHQNALYSARILKREGLQRILLVTSALHMPRALASFRRQGLCVIPAATPDADTRIDDAWIPQSAALRRSGRCLREYFGLWIYKLRGWA